LSTVDIFLDTDNELAFSVEIQGAAGSTVKSQFVLEGPKGINLCFQGRPQPGEVVVDIPALKDMLSEGVYKTRLEMLVDDKLFTPLTLDVNIKPAIKVEAAVRVVTNQSQGPVVTASVSSRVKSAVIAETVAQPAKKVVEEPKEEEAASEEVKASETQQVQTESRSSEMAKGKKIKLTDKKSGKTYVMTEGQLKNLREAAKNEGMTLKEILKEVGDYMETHELVAQFLEKLKQDKVLVSDISAMLADGMSKEDIVRELSSGMRHLEKLALNSLVGEISGDGDEGESDTFMASLGIARRRPSLGRYRSR